MKEVDGESIQTPPYHPLGPRFEDAFLYALHLHSSQVRKGTSAPYISHLMSVSALVLESGGGEDEAIAALLHDSVEDQGGIKTLDQIRVKFGSRVAEIVDGCTDSYKLFKPPWRLRKEAYLRKLESVNSEVIRVSLADKLHNARSLLRDLRRHGETTWNTYSGGKTGTLWYYQNLITTFKKRTKNWMIVELECVVEEIVKLGANHGPGQRST
jgi:(p)ppGpp synthase/HD superfamily hydrolase